MLFYVIKTREHCHLTACLLFTPSARIEVLLPERDQAGLPLGLQVLHVERVSAMTEHSVFLLDRFNLIILLNLTLRLSLFSLLKKNSDCHKLKKLVKTIQIFWFCLLDSYTKRRKVMRSLTDNKIYCILSNTKSKKIETLY